ncbi:helix-turn-helix domain-containing protein [Spiribacter vilamensis]|nr:Fis family transcriptional regulator [Spiribacter vilamensis]
MLSAFPRRIHPMEDETAPESASVGPIRACVYDTVTAYFQHLDGQTSHDLHRMVIEQAEAPLLEVVMRECGGNQTRAADALGINRGTLRKKLRQYGLED